MHCCLLTLAFFAAKSETGNRPTKYGSHYKGHPRGSTVRVNNNKKKSRRFVQSGLERVGTLIFLNNSLTIVLT